MNSTMDQSRGKDTFQEAFVKNLTVIFLGVSINSINGMFVIIFLKYPILHIDPRYILYIHLVINDMLMVSVSVTLYVLSYTWPFLNVSVCCTLLILASVTDKNTLLTLAGMAIERYIAICQPLHHPQICTVRKTYILICLIWAFGLIPGLTDLIIVFVTRPLSIFYSSTFCSPLVLYNTRYHAEKTKIVNGICLSIVWIVLLYTYFRVLFAARKASTDVVSAKKAQSTILLHGVQLLLCMLSYLTTIINMMLVSSFPNHQAHLLFCTYIVINILPRLLSPLIYGIRDQKFVKHMKCNFSCQHLVKVEPT